MSGGAFAYFGYIIFFVLLLYVITLAIFLCIRRNNIKNAIEYRNTVRGTNDEEQDFYDRANYSFEFRTDFDMVAQSALGKGCKFFLCVSRVVGFVFFLAASILLNFVRDNHGLFYFTNWNSLLVTIYYLAASISSLLSVYAKVERNRAGFNSSVKIKWSYTVRCLGLLVHMLFEIAGASSMFVLIFDFYYQRENNADMVSLLNFVRALTVCALIFEMFLNHMNVRFDQYPATIAWTMAYLLFVWPAVFVGIMQKWPYFLLKTDSKVCFGYYMLIFVLNFACYLLWWAIYKIKKSIYIHYSIGRVGGNYWDDDMQDYHDDDMHLESTMNPMSMHGLLHPDQGIEMGHRIYDDDGYSVATSAYAIDGYGEGDYEGMEGVEYIDERAFQDPNVMYPMYDADGNMMMHPNIQYGYDPNIGYDHHQNEPNMQFDPNMQYDPNLPYVHYDPNMQYDPNVQFDPNFQYDPNMHYDPRFDPRNHPQFMQNHLYGFQHQHPNYPQYQHQDQQQHQHLWQQEEAVLGEASPQYNDHWDSAVSIAPFGGSGRSQNSQNFSSTYGQFGDESLEEGQVEVEKGHTGRQEQRVLPPRPYAGSALERGRSGRGTGRGAGRGSGASRGRGGDRGSAADELEPAAQTSSPIHVEAQVFDESAGDGEGAAFDYSVVDAWASFTGAGRVPRNAAEANAASVQSQSKSGGGFLSYLGFGGGAPASPKKGSQRGPPPASSSQKGSWFDGVQEGDHGEEDGEYDEEYNFGAEGPEDGSGDAEDAEGVQFSRSGKHKAGAFIASVAKNEAFRAPSSLTSSRRSGSGSGSGSNSGSPRAGATGSPRAAAGLIRPPSLHKMFRTGSRGANKEIQALNLQALGARETDSGKGEKSSGMPRPPSLGKMWRPGSFNGMSMSASMSASRSPLNLQTLESRTGPHLGRTASAKRMDPTNVNASGDNFDYSEMDAWASFNAAGKVPHKPSEMQSPAEKPSGFQNLAPMLAQKSREKAGPTPKGGWFDTEREGFENMREEAEHFHPEDQPHDSHLAGAYVANAAKTEAFRAPASLDSHKHKHPVSSMPAVSPSASEKAQAQRGMFRPPSVTRMFRSKSKESIQLQALGSQMHRPPSSNRLNGTGVENFDYSEMDAWASFNAAGRVPHNPEELPVTHEKPSGFQNLAPMLAQRSGEKMAAVSPKIGWFGAQGQGERQGEGGEEDVFIADPEADQVHDSHLAGAYVANAAKTEAFRTPTSLDSHKHKSPSSALTPTSAQKAPVQGAAAGTKSMFRPPSVTRMFRSKSKESIQLQALGSQMHRPPSSNRLNGTGAENFDYSEMDAWASFNAAGRVPHNPDEAGSVPEPSGFQDLGPMLAQRSGEKMGAPSPKHALSVDQEDGNDAFVAHSGLDEVHDSHLAGAYVAHAAKAEAFRAPPTLDKTTHRKAPPASNGAPRANPMFGMNPMLRPPSLQNMMRVGSRGTNNEASRTVNINALGARDPAAAARSGEKSGASSGTVSGEKGGMFRPPSVPQMKVNRSMAPMRTLGQAPVSGVKAGAVPEQPTSGHNRSFFEQPEEEGDA